MNTNHRFFYCTHCKNLVGVIHASGAPLVCCGEPMTELVPNSTDAAGEKHVPIVSIAGNLVTVEVGSTAHPMTPEHLIEWIYIQTEQGGQRKLLTAGDAPKALFALHDDSFVAAYAYCNLHGLWISGK